MVLLVLELLVLSPAIALIVQSANCGSHRLFQLGADLRYLIQILNGALVALQDGLNNLSGAVLALGKLLQLLGVLLLLLVQLIIKLA